MALFFLSMSADAAWEPTTRSRQGDVDYLTRDEQAGSRYREQLKNAWQKYHSTDFQLAGVAFEDILASNEAEEPDVIQAHYGAGLSYSYLAPFPNLVKARHHFGILVESYAENPIAPWALIELSRIENLFEGEGRKRAREYLQQLFKSYPESLAIHEGALRLANTYFYEVDPELTDQGVALLEDHLENHPENPLASIMHYRLAYWYTETMHAHDKALPHSLRVGHLRMADPFRWSRHYWHIAQLYRLKFNDPESARPWLQKILDEAPQSEHAFSAKMILEQMQSELPDQQGQ